MLKKIVMYFFMGTVTLEKKMSHPLTHNVEQCYHETDIFLRFLFCVTDLSMKVKYRSDNQFLFLFRGSHRILLLSLFDLSRNVAMIIPKIFVSIEKGMYSYNPRVIILSAD